MAVLAFGFFFFIQLALQGCSNHQIFLGKVTTKIVGKMEMERVHKLSLVISLRPSDLHNTQIVAETNFSGKY